jgi:hypothetical protein
LRVTTYMMRRLIYLFSLSAFCLLPKADALAQQEFQIKGVVMENGSNNRIALSEITNKRNKFVVGSNDLGIFQIKAAIGDTLVVVKRDFGDREIIITSQQDVVVRMNRTTLNTVNIYGQTRKEELNEIKKEFRNKGSFYAGKPPILSYIFTPLTAIYELFGKTPKNAKRFNRYYNNEMQQSQIDGFFNEELIKKNTPLTGKDLENFMLNYRPDYEKAKNWTTYDAIKHIRDSYTQYADTLNKQGK